MLSKERDRLIAICKNIIEIKEPFKTIIMEESKRTIKVTEKLLVYLNEV
jgi:hypothetical protein